MYTPPKQQQYNTLTINIQIKNVGTIIWSI